MATESPTMPAQSSLSPAEKRCLDALDTAVGGDVVAAVKIVEGIDAVSRKRLPHEFSSLLIAIEAAGLGRIGEYFEGTKKLFTVLPELERSVFQNRLAWLNARAAMWLGMLGDPERGLEWSQRAITQWEIHHDSATEHTIFNSHGSILGMLGRYEEAIAALTRALDGRDPDNPLQHYAGLNNLAYYWLEWARNTADKDRQNELATFAVRIANDARKAAANTKEYPDGVDALATYCGGLVLLGEAQKAQVVLDSVLQGHFDYGVSTVDLMVSKALTLAAFKDWDGALKWLDDAERYADENQFQFRNELILESRLQIEQEANRTSSALKTARRHITLLKANYAKRLRGMVRNAEIFADAERSRWEAEELRTQSLVMAEKIAALDRQRSLGQMSATLGHEINQPLTAIQTSAQALQRSFAVPGFDVAKQEKMAERIVTNVRRAAEIVAKIRNFIKPAQAVNEWVNLSRVIHEVTELLANDAMVNGVQIDMLNIDQPAFVMGDAMQLSQVLVNIARNAMEAMAQVEERVLTIALLAVGQQWHVQLRDTGPGFSGEELHKIGTPFYTSKSTGLGIGLSISGDILKMHNGSLTIGNGGGGGAQLVVCLPRAEPSISNAGNLS